MKMISRQQDNKWFNKTVIAWLVVLIIVILIVATNLKFVVVKGLHYIASPVWSIGAPTTNDLSKTSSSLQDIRLRSLNEELERLTQLLGREEDDTDRLLGAIVSPSRSSLYDTFWVDVGRKHRVSHGDIVGVAGDVIIGHVVEVFDSLAKVQMYSAFGSEVEVMLNGDTKIRLEGSGSQNFSASLPKGLEISEGDTLYIPGLDLFVLAIVGKVSKGDNKTFLSISARSPVNILGLSRVFIIRGSR